jgi:isopentenyldiphosphate isomerase
MELWDVYDVNRVRTGKIISRPAAWGQETYHLIVHVCVFNPAGQMLIQKRCHKKHAWPDLWDVSAGGSALAGEDSWQAAERETMEELGLKISLKDVRPHFSVNYTRGFDDFYSVITEVDPSALTLQESEVEAVRWATQEEVRRMLSDHTFVPYFPGLLDLIWQVRDNYDGAISEPGRF